MASRSSEPENVARIERAPSRKRCARALRTTRRIKGQAASIQRRLRRVTIKASAITARTRAARYASAVTTNGSRSAARLSCAAPSRWSRYHRARAPMRKSSARS
ncbi:MAG TPA: hypothetical protein VL242_48350 [Sorangium sp.]|nr:hypothetical protein [Sorangium sp.]